MALAAVMLLAGCQSIPEWDKETIDNPIEDGHCPNLSGRFNYEHLGAKNTRGMDSILGDNLTSELPADPIDLANFKSSGAIYLNIYKGKFFDAYQGTVIVTLTRLDQSGRKYHVRVDWDKEGLLGEYGIAFDQTWICSDNKLLRLANSTLHERPNPDEIDPRDYRRIYVLPNGNIRIDRKHTYIYKRNQNHFVRYYESRVFARVP
jgi:hypothetical protein